MPKNWKIYRLSEIAKTNSSTIGRDCSFKEILYLDTGSVTEGRYDLPEALSLAEAPSRAKRVVNHNDIIYSTVRPNQRHYGLIKNPKENLIVSTGFCVITPTDVNSEFLYYYLTTDEMTEYLHTIAEGSTTTYPSIKPSVLEEIVINLPPLPEQKAIANILSAIEDKIENNLAINKTLEDMAMALYKHWFVDFGPFQDGEFIDSELGPIPQGWDVKPLGDFIEIVNGYAFKGKDFIESGVPVLKIKNVKAGKILLNKLSYVSRDVLKKAARAKINFRDILITMTGNRMAGSVDTWVGKVAMFLNKGEYYLNQRVSKLDLSEDYEFFRHYFSVMLSSDEFQFYFINNSTSSGGQANISPDLIKNTKVIIPPHSELLKFDKLIREFFNQIFVNQDQSENLTILRDTLLPKLISGEVRLKEFREQVENVIAREGKSELPFREDNVLTMIVPKPVTGDAAIIGTHIVSRLAESNGMGRTKFQKVLHLGEYYCEKELGGLYKRKSAGPHNDILLKTIEGKFKNYRHVSIASEILNGRKHIIYKTTPRTVESESIYKSFSDDLKLKLDYLIDVLEPLNLKQTEAISTLYAVWNNRLIQNAEVSSQCLKKDFYNWSDRKRKEFTDNEIAEAMEIMKNHNLIPRGWGDYIN